jgi:hypothetical protein
VIEQVRRQKPHIYLQIIASLLPRQLHVERTSPLSDISDEELAQIEELLAASRAKLVEKAELNGVAVADKPPPAPIFPLASPESDNSK